MIDADLVGQRFLVNVALPDQTTIRLLADTGGGYHVDPDKVAGLPRFPLPDGSDGVRLPVDPPMPPGRDLARLQAPPIDADGITNAWWFPGHVWSFDYRTGVLQTLDTELTTGCPLGLLRSPQGDVASPFPRVEVIIDDEPISLLLDTGATIELTDAGRQVLGEPRFRASSFIVEDQFNRWRRLHPEWRVIEGASTIGNSAVIEVPRLTLGETTLGSTWFERRPNAAFHQHMSQWMDERIDGALGASAFQQRELIIDYRTGRVAVDPR